MVLGSSPVAVTYPSDFVPASSKEFLDIEATIVCGFTLKLVRDMTRTQSELSRLMIFFDRPGSELLWSIFICLHGDLLRGCLLHFCFFIVNCTSFVGILLNLLLPKKRIQEFFLYLFQFADKCFGSNHRTWNSVIYRRFTWKIEIYWRKCWNYIIICGNCLEKWQVHYEWQIKSFLPYSIFWQ